MQTNNKILKPLLLALGAIAVISSGSLLWQNKEKAAESGSASDTSGSGDKLATAPAAESNLALAANKCRGCGRCMHIDPEHFALDTENRTAIVISTDNLSSESLQLAANNCPAGAITIS